MAGMDAMAAMAAHSKHRKAVKEGQSMAAGSDGVMKVRPDIWNDVETPHGSFWGMLQPPPPALLGLGVQRVLSLGSAGHVVPGSAFLAAGIRWFMQYGVEEFGLGHTHALLQLWLVLRAFLRHGAS